MRREASPVVEYRYDQGGHLIKQLKCLTHGDIKGDSEVGKLCGEAAEAGPITAKFPW